MTTKIGLILPRRLMIAWALVRAAQDDQGPLRARRRLGMLWERMYSRDNR